MNRPKIFLSVGTYLPGYRGGGPTQSVKNLVEALSDEFEFYIFTANHDLGVNEPYENVDTDSWNKYGGVNIFYSSDQNKSRNLKQIFKQQEFSLIFLNSFFNTDTIRILFLRKQLKIDTPFVLMPRGELSEGALNIKKTKKVSYIKFAKFFGLLDKIHYLSTAEDEHVQIQKLLETDKVHKVSNIPNTEKKISLDTKEEGKLKVVFLSRITQKKNLDYALKTLNHCKGNIYFDIYGTIEEKKYWEKCQEIISTLPNNITVNYKGELLNEKVISTLSHYDLFYFPTKSENYGHVISEALQASIPVLISDQTPWKELEVKGLGWEYSLDSSEKFSKKITQLASVPVYKFNELKRNIHSRFTLEKDYKRKSQEYRVTLNELSENER